MLLYLWRPSCFERERLQPRTGDTAGTAKCPGHYQKPITAVPGLLYSIILAVYAPSVRFGVHRQLPSTLTGTQGVCYVNLIQSYGDWTLTLKG